ncbi:MAG: hypothetical protein GF364_18145 [Candidatus Lokiarchaeota archaeon]|nr:hypothetical protein [Candidatus Lokiarchaeota archaeon]
MLKVGIFYFSGTGTTAFFADYLAKVFQQRGNSASTIRIKKMEPKNLQNLIDTYDLMGFGAPAWVWNPPRMFSKRIKGLKFPGKPYFVFSTCEGSSGNTHWKIMHSLRHSKGIFLGEVGVYCTNNIRSWRSKKSQNHLFQVDKETISKAGLVNGQQFVLKTLETINSNSENKLKEIEMPKPHHSLFWRFMGWFFTYRFQMQLVIGRKHVDIEKCSKCGLCATKICPSGAISLTLDNFPKFNESKCIGCQGCVNLCPTLAIDGRSTKNKEPFTTYGIYIIK